MRSTILILLLLAVCLSVRAQDFNESLARANQIEKSRVDPISHALGGLRGTSVGADGPQFPFESEGTTIRLNDGTLVHAFNLRYREPGMEAWHAHYAPTVIAWAKSENNGRTWSRPEILFESNTGQNASHPSLVRLANGALGASYQRIDTYTLEEWKERTQEHWKGAVRRANKVFRYSWDEGETWSEEIQISPQDDDISDYWTSAHDRMLVLSSGRIIHPLHTITSTDPYEIKTAVAYSDDNGLTWQLAEKLLGVEERVPGYTGSKDALFHEVAVAERADGSLYMIGRTVDGRLYFSISEDQGETWTEPKPTSLRSPDAPGNVVRVPGTDDLLVVWNSGMLDPRQSHVGQRLTLSFAISTDGGTIWKWQREFITIPPPPADEKFRFGSSKVCYPSLYIDDDTVYIGYWAGADVEGRGLDGEYVAAMPLSYFYALRDYHRPELLNGKAKTVTGE